MYDNNMELTNCMNEWAESPVIDMEEFFKRSHSIIEMMKRFEENTLLSMQPAYFRGQPKSGDPLRSTLERKAGKMRVHNYYSNILEILPVLESHYGRALTQNGWDKNSTLHDYFNNEVYSLAELPWKLPLIEYLVFLRHHGYPSPLLDWSYSPYIALYFAMRNSKERVENTDEMPAVYCFIKSSSGISGGDMMISQVFHLDPIIKTTTRHYNQQAVYTICAKPEYKSENVDLSTKSDDSGDQRKVFWFESHEDVLNRAKAERFHGQDMVIKFIIKDVRKKVLESLNRMNINDYTLFNTTDSLVYWLAESKFVDYNLSTRPTN